MTIPYIRLYIKIQFPNPISAHFPEAMFRGALGYNLKRLVCLNKRESCEKCFIRNECAYHAAFITPRQTKKLLFKNINTPPHPYVIHSHIDKDNKNSIIELIFFKSLFRFVNYFVYAFIKMGELGVGRERNKYDIISIYQDEEQKDLFDKDNYAMSNIIKQEYKYNKRHMSNSQHTIRVNFITPLRLKTKSGYLREVTFTQLIKFAYIRLTLLADIYGERTNNNPNKKKLILQAKRTQTISKETSYKIQKRYSSNQRQKILMGGIVGEVDYGPVNESFFSLLDGGGLFGIGKNTTFGYGRFTYNIIPR